MPSRRKIIQGSAMTALITGISIVFYLGPDAAATVVVALAIHGLAAASLL